MFTKLLFRRIHIIHLGYKNISKPRFTRRVFEGRKATYKECSLGCFTKVTQNNVQL